MDGGDIQPGIHSHQTVEVTHLEEILYDEEEGERLETVLCGDREGER